MKDKVFIDTNIFVYAFLDTDDSSQHVLWGYLRLRPHFSADCGFFPLSLRERAGVRVFKKAQIMTARSILQLFAEIVMPERRGVRGKRGATRVCRNSVVLV
ncbi:MAG: hypothetical protein WC856_27490 [Methylococcaceae bacterium]|jgi:hypothetical protein